MNFQLIEVTPGSFRRFHDAARQLYRDDPNWIAPLDMEVENIFTPGKNRQLDDGEAIRWVLVDERGKYAGRVAAFINHGTNRGSALPAGGIGFFECIDDQEAANVLFDVAVEWLKQRGAVVIDAGINFGENFSYWGVLIEGFTKQGYGMPYNKCYYQKLYEAWGFRDYFQQFSYHMDPWKPLPERMLRFADFLGSRPGYSFRHFVKSEKKKFIQDLVDIFNTTWDDYMEDYHPLSAADIEKIIEGAGMLIEEEFIWFAYKDERPIGMVVAFPDVNQLLVHFNGKLNFLKILKLLWLKRRHAITRNRVLLAGVIPEYQNSGVIAPLFYEMLKLVRKRPWFTEIELSWVGDYNPRMRKVYEQIGAVQAKRHITYRFITDPAIPFERFTNMGGNSMLRREQLKKEQ